MSMLGLKVNTNPGKDDWINVEVKGIKFRVTAVKTKTCRGRQVSIFFEAPPEVVIVRENAKVKR